MYALGRRPTFFPGSRLHRLDKAAALQDPTTRMLCGLANTLADLAHPKAALPLLADLPRLSAYEAAIQDVLLERPGDTTQFAFNPSTIPFGLFSVKHPILKRPRLTNNMQKALKGGRGIGSQQQLHACTGAHVLVLGQGSGILALLAARAGAERVSSVERSRMLYRMAKQVLAGNTGAAHADRIALLDCPLSCIGVAGAQQPWTRCRCLSVAHKRA